MTTENPTPLAGTAQRRIIRVRTLTRLRWFAIAGQLTVVLFTRLGLGYEMPVGPLLAVMGIAFWYNLWVNFTQAPQRAARPNELVQFFVFDILQISAILFLTGGIQNPFAVWLILPPMLAAASLDRIRTVIVLGAVTLALTIISIVHYPLPWDGSAELIMPAFYDFGTWLALLFGVGFVSAYARQVASDQIKLSAALDTTQRVLAREERLTALGGLAAAAAHELGTPLATIQVTAREMESDLPDGPLKEDAQLLISQTQRCQSILRRLSHSGENPDAHHNVMSLDEVLKEAAKPFLTGQPVNVRLYFDDDSEGGPPDRLKRLPEVIYGLRTLIENAVKFAHSEVIVSAKWDDRFLTVRVEDDGPGFPQEILARLGEPYPRHDPGKVQKKADPKQGLGLGFFIAKTLLERTGATISAGNKADTEAGARVELSWPLANLRAAPISKSAFARDLTPA